MEACGLMGGKAGAVHRVYLLANQENSAVNYRIDPREQLRVMNDIWGRGEELVAIFHSHPASPAYPSKTDIELAYYPESAYLIISLAAEDPSCRVFRITEGRVGEGSLDII